MEDLKHEFIIKAKEQYQAACRWTWVALFLGIFFHLTIMTPYTSFRHRQMTTEVSAKQSKNALRLTNELTALIMNLQKTTESKFKSHLDQFVKRLRSDFLRLDDVHHRLQRESNGVAAGTPLERKLSELQLLQARPPHHAVQMQIQGYASPGLSAVEPLEIDDEELKEKLKRLDDRKEILKAVRPFVEKHFIAPTFVQLNQVWRENIQPEIIKKLDNASGLIASLKSTFPQGAEIISQAEASFSGLRQISQTMTFKPPPEPYWWASVRGKTDTSLLLHEQASRSLLKSEALDAIRKQIESAIKNNKSLKADIKSGIKKLENQLKEVQNGIAKFSKTFNIISIDLKLLSQLFPFFIAVGFGVGLLWRTSRIKDLAVSALELEGGGDRIFITHWIKARPLLGIRKDTDSTTPWSAWLMQSFILTTIGIAWCWISIYQTHEVVERPLGFYSIWALCCLFIIVSIGIRLYVIRSIMNTVSEMERHTG